MISKNKVLILGLVALLGMGFVSTFYGNLSVPVGGSIVDGNASLGSCVQVTTGLKLGYTGLPCGTTGTAYTFSSPLVNTTGTITCPTCFLTTGAQTANGNKIFDSALTTVQNSSGNTNFVVTNTNSANFTTLTVQSAGNGGGASGAFVVIGGASTGSTASPLPSPSPGPYQIGHIRFDDQSHGGALIDDIYAGITDDGAGNHGGYLFMQSSVFGPGPNNLLEAVQAVPNGHVGMPQDITEIGGTSPSTCTAGVTCLTIIYDYSAHPYVTNAGVATAPLCTGGLVRDQTDSTMIWTVGIKTKTSTSAVFNLSPTTNTAVGHALVLDPECHEASF